jgi:hypothetical protein
MEILKDYLYNLQEGYFFGDKTISVNLEDFENGIKKKLLIVGLAGSGKTTLGEFLVKKYEVGTFISDTGKGLKAALRNKSTRMIIEGAQLLRIYNEEPEFKPIIINSALIVIGLSALKAGWRADRRDSTLPGKAKDWKDSFYFTRLNFSYQHYLSSLRKDIMKLPNARIEEYKIPKFETVLH